MYIFLAVTLVRPQDIELNLLSPRQGTASWYNPTVCIPPNFVAGHVHMIGFFLRKISRQCCRKSYIRPCLKPPHNSASVLIIKHFWP